MSMILEINTKKNQIFNTPIKVKLSEGEKLSILLDIKNGSDLYLDNALECFGRRYEKVGNKLNASDFDIKYKLHSKKVFNKMNRYALESDENFVDGLYVFKLYNLKFDGLNLSYNEIASFVVDVERVKK